MQRLELRLVEENQDGDAKTVTFSAPSELLLSGFKFTYVSPEGLADSVFKIGLLDQRFKAASKSSCLEEAIFNMGHDPINIRNRNQQLSIAWSDDQSEDQREDDNAP